MSETSASRGGNPGNTFTEVLAQGLTTECNPSRVPDNFWASLDAACSATDKSFLQALLRAGLKVWFAYFLASQQGTAGGLHLLSPADLALLTGRVARITPHESVTRLLSHISGNRNFQRHRDYLNSVQSTTSSSSPNLETLSCAWLPAGGITTNDDPIENDPMENIEHVNDQQQVPLADAHTVDVTDTTVQPSNFSPIYGTVGFAVDLHAEVAYPPAKNLGFVFPPYLTKIISKFNGTAWLKLSFRSQVRGELELFIEATETQHVVKEVFGLYLASRDNQRGILNNYVFQKIKGSLELSGSPIENVEQIMGRLVAEACHRSLARKEEVIEGQTMITNCLSLEVWPEPGCPSRLTLQLDLGILSSIRDMLFTTS